MRESESVAEYIARLIAADEQRIRVHRDYQDPRNQGNVIVQPVIMFGKDTSDDIRPVRMDTSGRIDVTGVCPTHQADAFFQDASPGSGTVYEVLAETEYVRLISIAAQVKWTVQPTPLEIYLDIDGNAMTATRANPVDSTWYYVYLNPQANNGIGTNSTIAYATYKPFLVEARTARVRVEITGGTVTLLKCVVKYAVW